MTWANTAASLSRGKGVPHALEGARPVARHQGYCIFWKGWGGAEDWLGKVSALLFSTCRVYMALAKAC